VLIDFNAHLYDDSRYGDALAETAQNLGLDRVCICGGESQYGLATNAEVRRQADSLPDLFVPFARISPAEDGADTVERLARAGFAGLRVWAPPVPYDDPSCYDMYEAAQALGMPVVFHTGFLPPTPLDRARGVRSANMRPVCLDTLARRFPDLVIIGTGLGSPWCEEAAETLRQHSNVYFDLSGDLLRRKGADFIGGLLRPTQAPLWEDTTGGCLWSRVLFGSGTRHEEIASVERDYQRIFRSLALGGEDVAAVMGVTAAGLLGVTVTS
jgi:predicted TIM-barrel fold metal-dependent hydrolase